ncbi:MAG: hypothetical protein RLZZ511_2965 [Cyanobacteriota bacterium]|jgi:hypothetical protein
MRKLALALATIATFITAHRGLANTETRWEYQGKASTGEKVSLNLDSIAVVMRSLGGEKPPSYWFTYQIGRDQIFALTPCDGRFQVSKDGDIFENFIKPQSAATQKMLDRVCSYHVRSALVFAPPSNVRTGPDGDIRCRISRKRQITTYGSEGDWFYTDACGKLGMIHVSQIKFE